MTVRLVSSFERRWTIFWATTYTFEIAFFEGFLLPRLGDPPLNATLMVDRDGHANALQGIGPDTPWRGARANRDYLIRGVAPTNGVFHPKTYFFADEKTGVLYVGSGNLTMSGLETGKELFVRFDASDGEGLDGIRAWRAWMDSLLSRLADTALADRWRKAQLQAPWIVGPPLAAHFVDNWSRPLLDALLDGLDVPVDELWVTAPFYDEKATALAEIIARTQAQRIHVVLGRDASVDGPSLATVLADSGAEVSVHGLEPDVFLHGKLVGAISNSRGRILSGSANLSRAAMLLAASAESAANVECGAIADVEPDAVRGAFLPPPPPPGLHLVGRSPVDVVALKYERPEKAGFQYHLRSVVRESDGRLSIDAEPDPDESVQLTDGGMTTELVAGLTRTAIADDTNSRLVWLVSAARRQLSNKVAVDEPSHLAAALASREQISSRPAEMEAADMETPVGQMLARLHDACIFDFDETPAARRIARAAEAESEDPEFWERLANDELQQDPRVARYHQLAGDQPVLDGVFLDIARMLEMVPPEMMPPHLAGSSGEHQSAHTGKRWTSERKLQVRLFNLLERWCRALSDPRLQWIGTLAPVGNFAALCGALEECWHEEYLPEHRVVPLIGTLLTSFVREERRPGFLAHLEEDDRISALALLSSSRSASTAAALAYASVRHGRTDLLSYLFSWQPAIRDGLEWNVLRADSAAAEVVETLTGSSITADAMNDRLLWASTYINDARWSEIASADTGLRVALTDRGFAGGFGATLDVGPGIDLLRDHRVVEIIRRALAYRQTSGCIVESGQDRLSIRLGQVPAALINGQMRDAEDRVALVQLEEMAATGVPLLDLGWPESVAA